MSSHKKISILGSGRVGSSIAYSLILEAAGTSDDHIRLDAIFVHGDLTL